uniref:Sodium/hydrogen exchanger n=1 Tax=Panagrolaimus sp. JU765 TaxID=591449 RepID=A0AC34RT31_9BILA
MEHGSAHSGVHVVAFKFEYVKAELVVCVFIVLIGLFKLVYHQLSFPRNILPESCCLIALGCCIGAFIRWMAGDESANVVRFLEFDSKIFFFFLLPPIILEAAYDLNDKAFIDNFGTIVLYAVVGTVLNIAIIGGSLIFFGFLGLFGTFGIHALDCLLFASLIAAVDPVAVLAIFKEVGVNKMLYFMVFGESLLNDAVTVVCYNLIQDFKGLETIRLFDCFLGFVAFLCVSFGGLIIGLIFGVFSTLITKYTNHVRVVEPVVCFGLAYLSYVSSELFHFSGIIGLISCGLFQTHFTMANLSGKSYISINYITKVVSSVSESLIFIILGVMLLNENSFIHDDFHPLFAIMSLVFCILARFIVVYFLTYIVNRFTGGVRYISFQEQFIMAYGGLRGAVSFSLCFMIDNKVVTKPTLLAAT